MSKSKKKYKNKPKREPQTKPDPAQDCQIYLITPPRIENIEEFAKTLEDVLAAAPIACLQIRLKDAPDEDIIKAAKLLVPICHRYGAMAIINDNPHIALKTGADGVHLGQSDMNINLAREVLNEGAFIGITCHNSKELAFKACSDKADYIAFGAFFETSTKLGTTRADLEILTWWHEAVEIPCVAIGGITTDNAKTVITAGADFIALCSGVWQHKDGPVQAAKVLSNLCALHSPPS